MITSIVIVACNQLEYTKRCIASIRKHTLSGSYELIVVDNGSTDGTPQWLEAQPDIKLRCNPGNEGFPRGCNQGIAMAEGELVMLLNNDTVVTPRWLQGLRSCLLSDPSIGAVGPCTNSASYMTAIETFYGDSMTEMERFANRFNRSNPAAWERRLKLIGFCMLIRRSALEQAGLLDERYGIGNFEDDDLSLRLLLAGYKLIYCRDTFIHHYGSVSFRSHPAGYGEILTANVQRFIEKWGFHPAAGTNVRLDLLGAAEKELAPLAGRPLTALHIGCCCGGTLLKLDHAHPGSVLLGTEPDSAAARIAEAAGVRLLPDSSAEWRLEEASLDVILLSNTYELDADPGAPLRLARWLKPGGLLAASFANRQYAPFIRRFLAPEGRMNFAMLYTAEQVKALLAADGLQTLLVQFAAEPLSGEDAAFAQAIGDLAGIKEREPLSAFYFICVASRGEGGARTAIERPGDLSFSSRLTYALLYEEEEAGEQSGMRDSGVLEEAGLSLNGGTPEPEVEAGTERGRWDREADMGEEGGRIVRRPGTERDASGQTRDAETERGVSGQTRDAETERDVSGHTPEADAGCGRRDCAPKAEMEPERRQTPGQKRPGEALRDVKEQNGVAFTGERLVVSREVKAQYGDVYEEHMQRYELAAALVGGLHVLDAACGAGYGSAMLKEAGALTVEGIDIDAASVERAAADYGSEGVTFRAGDVLALPFADESFDAVVSFETIEHVADGAAWIKESARVLKEGGLFIVSTPNRAVTNAALYFEEQPFNQHHRFEYRTAELVGELLERYDLEALYGQTLFDDSRFAAFRWLRSANGMKPDREPLLQIAPQAGRLVPLGGWKSGEPMYVVAVCRKRRGGRGG